MSAKSQLHSLFKQPHIDHHENLYMNQRGTGLQLAFACIGWCVSFYASYCGFLRDSWLFRVFFSSNCLLHAKSSLNVAKLYPTQVFRLFICQEDGSDTVTWSLHLSWGISLIHEFPDSLEVPVKRLIRSWIHNCCRCSVVISARLYQPTPQTRSQISGTPPKISTPLHLAVKIANKIDNVYWILAFNSWLEKAPGIKL